MLQKTIIGTDNLTLAMAKKHLNITFNEDDTLIQNLVDTSLKACENYCRDDFIQYSNIYTVPPFESGVMPLVLTTGLTPRPTKEVLLKYKDDLGTDVDLVLQPINQYNHDKNHFKYINNYIVIYLEKVLSVDTVQSVLIEWSTGYVEIETAINHARLLLIGTYYENREGDVVGGSVNMLDSGVKFLLEPYMITQLS